MKIVFLKVHPPYLVLNEDEWAKREYRERWLPRQAVEMGHQAWLFVLGDKPYPRTIETSPEVTFCPVDNKATSKNKHTSEYMLSRIKEIRPDLIVIKGLAYTLSSWLLEQTNFEFPFAFIVGGHVQDKYLGKASYILSETDEQTTESFAYFKVKSRVSVLPKSLDLSIFKPCKEKLYDIINVGSFEPRKNHTALIPLFNNYRVCLVGDGPTWNSIKNHANENVHMPKNVHTDKVAELIAKSILMVHPSIWEGFPRTIIESMACGVPIVALKRTISGIIKNGETGLLLDEKDLIPAVKELLKRPQLIEKMGEKGRQMALREYGKDSTKKILKRMFDVIWRSTRS